MEDDLITGLMRQIKEEVVENYLRERKLAFLQIESLQWQAGKTRAYAQNVAKCLQRLAYLTIHPEMTARLAAALNIPAGSYWSEYLKLSLPDGLQLIEVRGLTEKARFRKLVHQAYERLTSRMGEYRKVHEDLETECRAVNQNLKTFHDSYDLLAILSFLRSLDTLTVEKKLVMGDNFSAEEMGSLDRKLYIRPMSFEELDVPSPLSLPNLRQFAGFLTNLANDIHRKHSGEVRRIMR